MGVQSGASWVVSVLLMAGLGSIAVAAIGGFLWVLLVRGLYMSSACPRCGRARARPSLMPTTGDTFLSIFSLTPVRCLGCGLRFRIAGWSRTPRPQNPPPQA